MVLLLTVALILTGLYHGGCLQSKTYKWEPTESERKQIIKKAAEKMAESQQKAAK